MIRIDKLLYERKIYQSRTKAAEYIKKGYVKCNGKTISKPSQLVSREDIIEISPHETYVSRGAYKLITAINKFNIDFKDKVVLDIGSSTGGFTEVLLKEKAKKVIAIDVGKDQMHESLKNNPKLELYEETDFRDIDKLLLKDATHAVIDVSFISVTNLLDKLSELTNLDYIVCLIKPQFEVTKKIVGDHKGIILNEKIHLEVIRDLMMEFKSINFEAINLTFSEITGKEGNIEYLMYLANKNLNYKKHHSIKINEIISDAFITL